MSSPSRLCLAAVSLVAVVAVLAPPAPAGAGDDDAVWAPIATRSVLVEVDDLGVAGDATVLADLLDGLLGGALDVAASSDELDLIAAEASDAGLRALTRLGVVRRVEALPELELALDASVPTIGADDLHLDGRTGAGQAVVVIDTGVDPSLPGVDLVAEACFVPDWDPDDDAAGPDPCPVETGPGAATPCAGLPDDCSHGSHIAAIIAGDGGSFTGVAPDADIIAIRVTDDAAEISTPGVIEALMHVATLAETYDIAAVNLSLGGAAGDCSYPVMQDLIDALTEAGVAVVAASGNLSEFESWEDVPVDFPACLPGVVSVGASTDGGEVADLTQSLPALDLLAPGECIDSDALDDPPGFCPLTSGTSFAAPHVAAAYALVDGVHGDFDPARTRDLLRATGAWITRPTESLSDRDPRYAEIRLDAFVDFVPFADAIGSPYWGSASDWSRHTGVSVGVDGVVFGPSGTLDRAQAVTLLWRFMGSPTGYPPAGFVDVVPGSFYERAVGWAKATGVTTGTTASTFSPGEAVTRAQVAAFLWRVVGSPEVDHGDGFADIWGGEYYAEAVEWMDLHGITTGTAPGLFSPLWTIDRGQIITFLFRLARAADAWSGGVAPPDVVQF